MFDNEAMKFISVSSIQRIKKSYDELERIMENLGGYEVDVFCERLKGIEDTIKKLEKYDAMKNDDSNELSFVEVVSDGYEVFEKIKLLKCDVYHNALIN